MATYGKNMKLGNPKESMPEHALKKEKEFSDNLIQNATVPIFVVDRNHKIMIWNKACERLTGFMAEDMIGTGRQWQPFHNYPRPTLADIVADGIQERVADYYSVHSPSPTNPAGLRSEGWFTNLRGKKRYISFDAAPIYDSGGELIAAIETIQDISNRKKAEVELRKEKNFSNGLINSLPGIFFLVSEDMNFQHWNKNMEEISGYSSEQLQDMSPADLFTSDDRNLVEHKFRASPAEGKTTAELHLVTGNGARIPYFLQISSILINDEPHVIGTGMDLVDRYEIEQVLRKLSRAVEQSASSIVITDTGGVIEYVNPSFLQMTGCALEDVIGRNSLQTGSNLRFPDIFGNAWDTVKAVGEWRGEQQNIKMNGEYYWEMVSVSPIKNAEDVTTHYLAVKEDITARKKAERELRKSQAELVVQHEHLKHLFDQVEMKKKEWESTMDCIGDTVILTDTAERIKRCNKTLLELTGKSHQDISGAVWHQLLSCSGLPVPTPCEAGVELFHEPSGRWFVFNSYPYTDSSHQEVSGTVITLHDTTEVKRFTRELEKAYSDLKATQAKVIQQEKMASIGQLAAGVAHEINNPMGFISSNLNTLWKYVDRYNDFIHAQSEAVETLPDKEAVDALREKRRALKLDYILDDGRELIKESLDGAERVRTIVQNLKSFSRVDEAECKPADINECINSTINIAWNELKYKANLTRELGDIPLIRCYPQQINQVIMNLLVNAAQAIEKQGEIKVRTWHDNDSIYASVSDTGCGMPPEIVNRIFEPFFTTKEVGKGTGLGLSITYDIIKNHNGEITVASEQGKGTTFTVRLPVVEGKR